jgi:hypothetical protein
VTVTVTLSVIAHGISASLLASRYATIARASGDLVPPRSSRCE